MSEHESLPTDSGTGNVLPESDQPANQSRSRAGIGGTFSHAYDCKCNPCKARRRKQETLALAAGTRGIPLVASKPPEKSITTVKGIKKAAPKPLRERTAQFLSYSMAFPNASKVEIAEKMGITTKRLYELLTAAKKEGLLEFTDPFDRIDYEIVPKIIDNINHFLDAKDKTVTIEAAKGTIWKTYQESKGISDTNQTVLALKIEMPDGQAPKLMAGRIVGQPKTLSDAELQVIDLDSVQETES